MKQSTRRKTGGEEPIKIQDFRCKWCGERFLIEEGIPVDSLVLHVADKHPALYRRIMERGGMYVPQGEEW